MPKIKIKEPSWIKNLHFYLDIFLNKRCPMDYMTNEASPLLHDIWSVKDSLCMFYALHKFRNTNQLEERRAQTAGRSIWVQ